MGEVTGIEWCDHTFNPWLGCTKISPACDHCYAETWSQRFPANRQLWNGERRQTTHAYWRQALKWNKDAEAAGVRRRVFCASLAVVFDNQVPEHWRFGLWDWIKQTPALDWLLLTKRPQNIKKMLPADWGGGWPNVWLGTTVENQEEANRRLPHLLYVPAVVHFLSCEPLLDNIHLPAQDTYWHTIDWVIAGGESGPHARPPMIGWVRRLRDHCVAAAIPFHFKQWGEFTPDDPAASHTAMRRVGKKAAGALLDGREWRQFPHATPQALRGSRG